MSRTFASLRYFNYRVWFGGALVSNVGTWMQRIAQDWLVLTVLTDDSGVAVGVVTALQFLPFLLLSPYAGVVADRVDQRTMLIATQAASALLALGLGSLVLFGHVQLWQVYIFAFALGIASAFDTPVRQTFVTVLVPATSLPNAVGLNSASFNAARLIGPGVAGVVIAWIGTGWVFMVNGLTFIATIVALLAMRTSELHPQARAERAKGQVREAVRYVRRRADILIIMTIMAVVSTLGLNFQLTSALMARVEFGRGPGEYGALGSILAIGSLTGALLAARRARPRLRIIVGSAAAFGIALGLLAIMPSYTAFAIMCIPVGLTSMTLLATANAWIQTTTAPTMRARTMALYMMVLMGATPVGAPVVGWIGEHVGPRWSMGVGAIAAVVIAFAAAAWAMRYWDIELSIAMHRPFVRAEFGRTSEEAERAARERAALEVTEQQLEDARRQP
ncbi:MAG: MFS transporter [Actinomycetes bacterium]|nr:MAG: MFS transporter [Actinomycetota bacterium]